MSKSRRLQVLLDEAEMRSIRKIAREQGVTVAEWVRQTLRAARRDSSEADPGRKLQVVRTAARHGFPTADIEVMLAEIARGYERDDER
jgi:hypothetical protein